MTNINLLPWREQLREDRKKEFFTALGMVVAMAVAILLLGDRYINGGIDNQTALNSYIGDRIIELDAELEEIRELREQKALLTERMGVIQDLNGTRPIIVRLFDELVKTLPEDVYYSIISRRGDSISLEGVAESNGLISDLMRSLDASEWFSNPVLGPIRVSAQDAIAGQEGTQNAFRLNVDVTTPDPEVD
jgi:type IV pilus assembly protein PilN